MKKLILVTQGEASFSEEQSDRYASLTETGKKNTVSIANALVREIEGATVVIVSSSKRGKESEDLFRQLDVFRRVPFLKDESYWLDSAHPDFRKYFDYREIIENGHDTIIIVGHHSKLMNLGNHFGEWYERRLDTSLLNHLDASFAVLYDFKSEEGRVISPEKREERVR